MPEATMQTEWGSYFSKGLWRYIRPAFRAAGQDSFTDPPGQNEDMFEKLVNVMPPVQGDFDRRWGYQAWNTSVLNGPTINARAYPIGLWMSEPPGTRQVLSVDNNGLTRFNEDGSNASTIANFSGTPRTATSRGWSYIADGVTPKAWSLNGSPQFRNWGIDINNASANTTSANAGTAANVGSGVVWASPSNATGAPDSMFATVTVNKGQSSQQLQLTNLGFAIPAQAIIKGITVTGYLSSTTVPTPGPGAPGVYIGFNPQLVKGGSLVGISKPFHWLHGNTATITVGGTTDLWNVGWTPTDINGSNFGVAITGSVGNFPAAPASNTFGVDAVLITVYYSAPITLGAFSGTGVTLVSGRQYFTTFYNSNANAFSNIGQASVSTGPVTNQSIPLGSIPVSADPQVDRKKILATADGGDQTFLYELADITNATTSFVDNIPEATLLLNNLWQATLIDGTEVGVANNTPPLAGLQYPILHRGRVYGLVNSNLFYSKSLDELVTPTGAIAGNFEEAFPGLNFFPVTATGEQARGLLSDGTVLYIGTDRRIVRLFGDGPSTFLQPQALWDNVGILNQDVWKLVLIEGNPIGGMWLTPDARVLGSDFNTYQDIGTPVQDVLNNINVVAAQQTAWAVNVNISVFNLYVLAVPTGSNTQPDTLLVFDIRRKQWYVWQLTDTAVGAFWWVALGGTPQFIIQSSTGKYYLFNPALFQDRVNDTPVSFPVVMRTSWLPLGDSTARKYLQEIEVTTADPNMTVTVEGASLLTEFTTPNIVCTNAPLVVKPRGELAVFLAGSFARDRHYRFTFNATDTATDLLRGFNIRGRVLHRE